MANIYSLNFTFHACNVRAFFPDGPSMLTEYAKAAAALREAHSLQSNAPPTTIEVVSILGPVTVVLRECKSISSSNLEAELTIAQMRHASDLELARLDGEYSRARGEKQKTAE
jgi:hypothetical protein